VVLHGGVAGNGHASSSQVIGIKDVQNRQP
jgi:hypothetical protein